MASSIDRPILRLSRTPLELLLEVAGLSGLLLLVGLVLRSWSSLPERIPHHFNFRGEVDAWGGRWVLILMAALAAAFFAGFKILARFPHLGNYPVPITPENAERQYRNVRSLLAWLRVEVVWLFVILTWTIIQMGMGSSSRLGWWFTPVFLGMVLMTAFIHVVRMFRARLDENI